MTYGARLKKEKKKKKKRKTGKERKGKKVLKKKKKKKDYRRRTRSTSRDLRFFERQLPVTRESDDSRADSTAKEGPGCLRRPLTFRSPCGRRPRAGVQ